MVNCNAAPGPDQQSPERYQLYPLPSVRRFLRQHDQSLTVMRSLTPILTTRFISHLRTMDDPDGTRDEKLVSMVNFATSQCPPVRGRFVDSLGGDLDFGLNGFETDDGAPSAQAHHTTRADGSDDSTAILQESRVRSSRTGST